MCGIVGARDDWLRRRGRSPEASVATAVAALAWRGEDDRAVRRASGWWLGCARLAISAGEGQPIRAPAANTTAVLNGAITNARDLWRQLSPGVERRAPLPNDAALPSLAVSQRRTDLLEVSQNERSQMRAARRLPMGQRQRVYRQKQRKKKGSEKI